MPRRKKRAALSQWSTGLNSRSRSPTQALSSQLQIQRSYKYDGSLPPSSRGSVRGSSRFLSPSASTQLGQREKNRSSLSRFHGSRTNRLRKSANFRPHPGDIIIAQRDRKPSYSNGLGGFVALYSDNDFFERTIVQDQHTLDTRFTRDFLKGDIVFRMGTFDKQWKWHPGEAVQVFVCENKHSWQLVTKVNWHPLEPPVHREDFEGLDLIVPSRAFSFKPGHGDFIIRALPGIENTKKWEALWWHPGIDAKPYDILVRAGFEVSREFETVNSTLVVVEMYWLYDTMQYWIFVGRDSHTYTSNLSFAYTVPMARSDISINWQRMQDTLKRKHNRTFHRRQKQGKQKRVLDQPFDHHLPKFYDYLGFDDLGL